MSKQARFPVSELAKIQKELASLPERSPDEISCREAVAMLFPEIQALRKKGYSLAAIAKLLTEKGFAITEAALKKYLRDIARGVGKTKRLRRARAVEPGEDAASPKGDGTADASARDGGVEPSASKARTRSVPRDTSTTAPAQRAEPSSDGAAAEVTTSAPVGTPRPRAAPSGWTASVAVGGGTQAAAAGSLAGDKAGTSSATTTGGAARAAGAGSGRDE